MFFYPTKKMAAFSSRIHSLFLFMIFLLGGHFLSAQNADSLQFVQSRWKKERLGSRIHWITQHFDNKNLFGANQYISYVIIKNKKRKRGFGIAAEGRLLKTVQDLMQDKKALVAINGNFFDMKNGGSIAFVKSQDSIFSPNRAGKDGRLDFHQKAAVAVQEGKLKIIQGSNADAQWPQLIANSHIMASGPLLFKDGKKEALPSTPFNTNRHPRTAVGVTRKGDVILLVADGRQNQAAGLSLFELGSIMEWLDCTSAINFDGGGSTTLWIKGKGVVNHPSDNKTWDHEGSRKVANALYFRR